MNAKEAHEMAVSRNEDAVEYFVRHALVKIEFAARQGQFQVWISDMCINTRSFSLLRCPDMLFQMTALALEAEPHGFRCELRFSNEQATSLIVRWDKEDDDDNRD